MKYKRYQKYKDSGVEWIGEIPEHWIIFKLKQYCEVKDGTHDTPKYVDESKENYPLITSKDIINNNIDFSDAKYISKEDYISINRRSDVTLNDVIMPMIGTIGNPAIVNTDREFSIKNVALFKTNKSITKAKFLKYLIDSYVIQEQFNLLNRGGVQNFVSLSVLKNLTIINPKEDIERIVEYLDRKTSEIDSLVKDKEKLITLLEEKRQAIITEAVTKGLNTNVKMKDSGVKWIGNIPEYWETIKIKYIAKSLSDKSTEADNLKYLGLEHIEKETGSIIQGYEDMEVKIEGEALKYYKDNVLFGKLRPYLKKCIVAKNDGKCTSELLVLDTKENINSNYLQYVMLDDRFINEVNSSTYGAKMPRANWEFIRNIKIMLPSMDEQEKIVEYILKTNEEFKDIINKTILSIEKYKEYRQSLISEAVTGKIDVREYYSQV